MSDFLLFLLGVVGMTMIIVDSTIMAPVRDLLKKVLPAKVYALFECYQCTGFWTGLIGGIILFQSNVFVWFMFACAGSAASAFWAILLTYLEARSIVDLGKDE